MHFNLGLQIPAVHVLSTLQRAVLARRVRTFVSMFTSFLCHAPYTCAVHVVRVPSATLPCTRAACHGVYGHHQLRVRAGCVRC